MAPRSDLDIVVVTYNSAGELQRCTDALGTPNRLVIVDNASSDSTVAIAEGCGARVHRGEVNAGFAAACNQGAKEGSAPFILFLNPDTEVSPSVLDAMVEHLVATPGAAVASPQVLRFDGSPQRTSWPFPSSTRAWREVIPLIERGRGPGPVQRRASVDGFVIGACFLVRREAFSSVGGFDTRFWLYGEETDLCRRLIDAGWKVDLLGDLTVRHVGGASADSVAGLAEEHFHRGVEHFVDKHEARGRVASLRVAELLGSCARGFVLRSGVRRGWHRRRAVRLARLLVARPDSVDLDSPATRASGRSIVVCSLEPWDEVWRRNQFFVRELLAIDPNRRVLFVEPPFDWIHERRHPSGRARQRGLRAVDGEGRVVRFEPGKVWPRVFGPFADSSLRRQVRRAVSRLGFDAPFLWINDPSYAGLAEETTWRSTYDITDDWTQSGEGDRATRRVARNERKLFRACQAVTVCSPALVDSSIRRGAEPVLIPNAVDDEHFGRAQARPADLPAGPTAVYVGSLHRDRLDIDLVRDLAVSRPELDVVLVGPDSLDAPARAVLDPIANLYFLGAKDYAEVPGYLQHADVAIVPHVVSAFTESLDPIKAYELLAVATPVVATPVAGFRELDDAFVIAPRGQFVEAVDRAIAMGTSSRAVRPPSWAERAVVFDEALTGGVPSTKGAT